MVEHFPTDGQGSYIASALAPKLIDFVLSSSFDRREEAVFWWKTACPLSGDVRGNRTHVQQVGSAGASGRTGRRRNARFAATRPYFIHSFMLMVPQPGCAEHSKAV